MESLWQQWLIGNAVIASVMALPAWIAVRVFQRPAIAHFLWILALVKLMLPPLQTIPMVVAITTPSWHQRLNFSGPASIADVPSLWLVGLIVWAIGSCLVLAWIVRGTRRVSYLIEYRGRYDLGATQILAALQVDDVQVDDVQDDDITRVPQVWLVDAIVSPMLYCPLKWNAKSAAKIVFPKTLWQSLDGPSRRVLLAHELAHWDRRDCWVRFLEMFAMVCLWWHPLVWLAKQQIEHCEERCCDIAAVGATPRLRRTYAEAIMHTLDFLCAPMERDRSEVKTRPLASGVGRFPTMEYRLQQIMKPAANLSRDGMNRFHAAGLLLIVILISPSLSWRIMRSPLPVKPDRSILNASSELELEITPRFQNRER